MTYRQKYEGLLEEVKVNLKVGEDLLARDADLWKAFTAFQMASVKLNAINDLLIEVSTVALNRVMK